MTAALMRMELRRALANRWFVIPFCVAMGLALGSAALAYSWHLRYGVHELSTYRYLAASPDSCFRWWMALDPVQPTTILFYELMPLLCVIPYAWSACDELQSGYIDQVYARADRARYLSAKGGAVFVSSGLMALVPIVCNFLILACLIPAYLPEAYEAMYTGVFEGQLWSQVFYTVPALYVVLYSMLPFVICGCWGIFVMGLSFIVRNRVVLLAAPYVGVLLLQYVNERIFIALGALGGFQLGLSSNMRAVVTSYPQEGWIIALECAVLLAAGIALTARGVRGDAL